LKRKPTNGGAAMLATSSTKKRRLSCFFDKHFESSVRKMSVDFTKIKLRNNSTFVLLLRLPAVISHEACLNQN
jgi:hypothetical protein